MKRTDPCGGVSTLMTPVLDIRRTRSCCYRTSKHTRSASNVFQTSGSFSFLAILLLFFVVVDIANLLNCWSKMLSLLSFHCQHSVHKSKTKRKPKLKSNSKQSITVIISNETHRVLHDRCALLSWARPRTRIYIST